jgi:DNA-binding CsgD family transcriptional regulator
MQVLRLAARGLTEVETAAQLRLSRRGVQFHLARAGAKLDTSNKTAAVARAISLGLIKFEGHKRSDK